MLAACHAQPEIVKAAPRGRAPIRSRWTATTGATALHKACQGGNVECARLLLDAGAFVDAVTPTMGHTPVMDALWYKAPEVVDLLVERGANLNLDTHYGFTMWDHLKFELERQRQGPRDDGAHRPDPRRRSRREAGPRSPASRHAGHREGRP